MNKPHTPEWPRGAGAVFAPTFPLNGDEMHERIMARKAADPGTWLVVLALFVSGWALPVSSPFVGLVAASAMSFFWLRWRWRSIDARVNREVELEMIAESNREQDERLRARMSFYRLRGTPHLAEVLGEFLSAKRDFEARLARENSHFSTHEKMECLVDGLCIGVCDELEGVAVLDRRLVKSILAEDESVLRGANENRRAHLKAVRDAYVTLADAVNALKRSRSSGDLPAVGTAAGRPAARASRDELKLRNAIDGLREESEISRNVRARLESVGAESLN